MKVLVVGSTVVDLTFYTDRIPQVGETLTGRFVQGLGGKGFNQAVASALSGTQTAFVSAYGDKDAFGDQFIAKMKSLSIQNAMEKVGDESTGAAAISVDKLGRNNIIVSLGANEKLSTRFLDANSSLFRDVGVLLVQFETNLNVIAHALKLVREKSPGVLTILNPAPALTDIPREILTNVDLFTPNETELEIISGHKIRSSEDIAIACGKVVGPKEILATLGEKGCFYYTKESSRFYPAYKVAATDTSGAGDAFNGGLASGYVRLGGHIEKAIPFASAVAAISVTRPGTSASMPTLNEVEAFLAQHA